MSREVETFYVTTPIYYVNDIPHIGHAYTTVAADVLARFWRLLGKKVFFLTGTDEHGQKVQKAASERGLEPKAHADIMVKNFQALWKSMNISNDAFIRTTDEAHKRIVQELLSYLWEKGEIEKRTYKGWYCIPDEKFWTEKELIDGKCPDCGRAVEYLSENNYFFLMSKYQERLIQYIEENPDYILPETRRNEVLSFLKTRPLNDLCISRPKSRLSWGIELPFDRDYVTYVWFDALVNYYSATRYLAPEGYEWWPADHHIIGKDILITHAVYWSTMLMALDLPLPKNIFAHGWWTVEGRKMSKSLGNVVNPEEIIKDFGVDPFRYFLLREVPFGLDGDFSERALVQRINIDLANDLGNLVQRTISMVDRYFNGVVPATVTSPPNGGELKDERDEEIISHAEGILSSVKEALSLLAFHRALDAIWGLVDRLNKYIDSTQPWSLAKNKEEKRLARVLYNCLEGIRFIGLYIYPFMPETGEKIYNALGYEGIKNITLRDFVWGQLSPGTTLKKIPQLFPRIQREVSPPTVTSPPSSAEELPRHQAEFISIEDFSKIQLRVGKVIEAERVKGSNKLLRLIVDTGDRRRQIIAGIGKAYSPEELLGKNIVVVTNLKPARLMGLLSEGMLLAASDEEALSILTVEREIAPGAKIK